MAELNLAELVNQMPELDGPGPDEKSKVNVGKLTGIPWDKAIPIYDAILAGGKEAIVGVIAMLKEVDDGADYKARYTLHGIALYVCREGKEKQRAIYIDAVASQLRPSLPKTVQAFLVQELQYCGDKTCVAALGKLVLDDVVGDPAIAALTAIKDGAVEQFRIALPNAQGRAKLSLVQALGVLKDETSIPALKQAASDPDVETRIQAVWGLANMGDASSIDLVLKSANAEGWERIKNTSSCLLLAEKLAEAGKKTEAKRIYTHLRDTRTDPKEKYLREIADRALAGL